MYFQDTVAQNKDPHSRGEERGHGEEQWDHSKTETSSVTIKSCSIFSGARDNW